MLRGARMHRWIMKDDESFAEYSERMNEMRKSELKFFEEHDIEVLNKETAYNVKDE